MFVLKLIKLLFKKKNNFFGKVIEEKKDLLWAKC